MNKEKSIKIAKIMRYTIHTVLLIFAVFFFLFALFSGAEDYGGGILGIIQNSPNTLPWLLLLLIIWLTWKKELVSGLLLIFLGVIMAFFFNFFRHGFELGLIIISLPLIMGGCLLIFVYYLNKYNSIDKK